MTTEEIKQIERVIGKPISEIDEVDIPSYIRARDGIEKEDWEFAEQAEKEKRQHLEN